MAEYKRAQIIAESTNPLVLNRNHTRMLEELSVLKIMVERLGNIIKIIKTNINPLYETYNICSTTEAEYVVKLVNSRIKEYTQSGIVGNYNRIAWPKYMMEDVTNDINLLEVTLQTLNTELGVFQILQKNDGQITRSRKDNIRRVCSTTIDQINDVKLEDIAMKILSKGKNALKLRPQPVRNVINVAKRVPAFKTPNKVKLIKKKNDKNIIQVGKPRSSERKRRRKTQKKRTSLPKIPAPVTRLTPN